MTRRDPQYQLRLPEALREKIRLASEMSGRSMNTEIVRVLKAAFPADDPTGDEAMSRGDPQIKFRFPPEMHARIKARAEQNRRSMNAEVVAIMEADQKGEDLRDRFAMAALTGLLVNAESVNGVAETSYELADTMLRAREGGEA